MNMKRIYRYMGWLALPVALAACQDENGLSSVNAADGPYVLSASMPQKAQGRVFFDPAENPGDEVLYWNEKDQFQLFQPTADGSIPEPNVFTISEGYQESEKLRSADFTGERELNIGRSYFAFYPSALLVDGTTLKLDMKEDNRVVVADIEEYETYLRNHLFMKAKGTIKPSTVLQFEPLYSVVKIHYTNDTEVTQNVKRFQVNCENGGVYWGTSKSFNPANGDVWSSHISDSHGVELKTPVEIASKTSYDFYLLFFPSGRFESGREITVTIQTPQEYLTTLTGLDVMEIAYINNGADSFEPGKVYQFNVSQTGNGLEWNRDKGKKLITNKALLDAIEERANVSFTRFTNGSIDVDLSVNADIINSITVLNLDDAQLSSLVGIEYFTALTSLNCEANYLDRLDVSALTNLETLKCGAQKLKWDTTREKGLAVVLSEQQKQKWTDSWKGENGYGVFVEGLDILSAGMVTLLQSAGRNLQTNEDGTADCGINKDELFNCTYLYLSGKPITTWNEFAYFGNLKELHCSNCGLGKIDVSFLPKLQKLGLSNNQLEILDVSKNTGLVTLNASSNSLTAIDVSHNLNLNDLEVRDNKLTQIDVTMLTKLKVLDVTENQLKELNVLQNPLLTALRAQANQLTAINIGQHPYMEVLNLGNNTISEINFSGLVSLLDFNFRDNKAAGINLDFTPCSSIRIIDITDVGASSIKVSGLASMTALYCMGNQLQEVDLTGCTKLGYLDCRYNQLSVLDISPSQELNTLYCGSQFKDATRQESQMLVLTIAEWMLQKWNDSWSSHNINVQVKGLDSSNEDGPDEENTPADNE